MLVEDLIAWGPRPGERSLSPWWDQGGSSSVAIEDLGRLDRRRSGHTSRIQTPRAVTSPSVPQGRFRGRRKDPLGGRGGRKIRASPSRPAGAEALPAPSVQDLRRRAFPLLRLP